MVVVVKFLAWKLWVDAGQPGSRCLQGVLGQAEDRCLLVNGHSKTHLYTAFGGIRVN